MGTYLTCPTNLFCEENLQRLIEVSHSVLCEKLQFFRNLQTTIFCNFNRSKRYFASFFCQFCELKTGIYSFGKIKIDLARKLIPKPQKLAFLQLNIPVFGDFHEFHFFIHLSKKFYSLIIPPTVSLCQLLLQFF